MAITPHDKTTDVIGTEKPASKHVEYVAGDDGKEPVEDVDYSGAHEKSDPREISLVKKLDWYIMPTLWIMYWFNYLDRNAIALARLNNLEEDLNLTSSQYQTCVSILFVGYILGQVPSNMVLTRVRPSWWMSSWVAIWAIVSGLTALSQNYIGLLLTRFFLGVTEAPCILYLGNILATAFAGLIAIGIFELDGKLGIAGWRWLFIIQGAATFLTAIVAIFLLPDEPLATRWLNQEERQLAHDRIKADTVGDKGEQTSLGGLLEAAKDPKLWLFAFMQHMHLAANGFKNFFPTAVETLGFDRTVTLVLTCPPYLIAGFTSIAWSWSSGKYNERTWHITIAKSVAIFGFILGCATLNTGAKYFAMVVFSIGTYAVNSVILGWVAATCGQSKEKKACSLAIVNTIANVSFIWTPYLWPSSDEPRYVPAMTSSAAFSLATLTGAWIMRIWLIRINRILRQQDNESKLLFAY